MELNVQHDKQAISQITGQIHHTESFGAVDGPGIRYVFFLQGCSLHCLYCHNPDAIARQGGKPWTAGDVVQEALRYRKFIQSGGVTFSGGEPLLQAKFVWAASVLLRQEGIHVAVDTAGHVPLAHCQKAVDEVDMLLLDIKAEDTERCKLLTGKGNENAFQLLDYCEAHQKPVWIRHVLLRGYTMDDQQLEKLAERLKRYRCIQRIELLPFHKLGEPKWAETGMAYQLADTPATTREEVTRAKAFFEARGFVVQ